MRPSIVSNNTGKPWRRPRPPGWPRSSISLSSGKLAGATFVLARQHYHTEQYIKETGAHFVFLRDAMYLDFVPAAGRAATASSGDRPAAGRQASSPADDVAEAAAAVLASSGHDGQTFDMTGPESIDLGRSRRTSRPLHRATNHLSTGNGRGGICLASVVRGSGLGGGRLGHLVPGDRQRARWTRSRIRSPGSPGTSRRTWKRFSPPTRRATSTCCSRTARRLKRPSGFARPAPSSRDPGDPELRLWPPRGHCRARASRISEWSWLASSRRFGNLFQRGSDVHDRGVEQPSDDVGQSRSRRFVDHHVEVAVEIDPLGPIAARPASSCEGGAGGRCGPR